MKKFTKIFTILMVLVLGITFLNPYTLNVTASATTNTSSSIKLYVNGKAVSTSKGTTFKDNGVTYVPALAVVQGMSGIYSYDSDEQLLTVTRKDKKKVVFDTSKSTVTVSGKKYPLVTKTVNGVEVPVDIIPIVKSGKIYIPISSVKTYMKYTVTTKKVGTTTYIFVGKVITVKGETTPTPSTDESTSTHATSDREANIDWIVKNLGFQRLSDETCQFNPANKSIVGALITVGWNDEYGTTIIIKNWDEYEWYMVHDDGTETRHTDNNTNKNVKALLKFYFPKSYQKLYTIIDNGYTGKGGTEYLNKEMKYDGIKVKLVYSSGWLRVLIGTNDLK